MDEQHLLYYTNFVYILKAVEGAIADLVHTFHSPRKNLHPKCINLPLSIKVHRPQGVRNDYKSDNST